MALLCLLLEGSTVILLGPWKLSVGHSARVVFGNNEASGSVGVIPHSRGNWTKMSIHRTLRNTGALKGTRNVLTRYERILQLEAEGRFTEGEDDPFGLPKTRVLKVKKRAKEKKETEEVEVLLEAGVEVEAGAEGEADKEKEKEKK